MMKNKKGQTISGVEFLTTYGWAILAALIAIGTLAYFGFLNPVNLLPSNCDFGNQVDCVEYEMFDNATLNIKLRNNFGKDINITDVDGDNVALITPFVIPAGIVGELSLALNQAPSFGEKSEANIIIIFARAGGGNPSHNLSGKVFDAAKEGN